MFLETFRLLACAISNFDCEALIRISGLWTFELGNISRFKKYLTILS